MSGVAVVTDTTQYLPQEVVDRHGLSLVSLYVNWDGRTDRESEMPGFGDFYAFLKGGGELPSTSQPSVGDFLAVYEPLLEAGKDVVSIHLSGGISGTVRSAEQARDALVERGIDERRIVVLDSRTGAAGHGLMAVAADNAAKAGANAQEAADAAVKVGERMTILFAVDTLEYLRRGGRIGPAAALLGSAFAVKPLLHLVDGHIEPLEKVRTSAKAIARLEELAVERAGHGPVDAAVHHLANPDRAAALAERLRDRLPGLGDLLVSEVGAVVGAHVGPGMLAVVVAPSGPGGA
jgi:DegV family protein with EDD domain